MINAGKDNGLFNMLATENIQCVVIMFPKTISQRHKTFILTEENYKDIHSKKRKIIIMKINNKIMCST